MCITPLEAVENARTSSDTLDYTDVEYPKRVFGVGCSSDLPASDGAKSLGVPQLLRQQALVLLTSPHLFPLLLPLVNLVHQHLADEIRENRRRNHKVHGDTGLGGDNVWKTSDGSLP